MGSIGYGNTFSSAFFALGECLTPIWHMMDEVEPTPFDLITKKTRKSREMKACIINKLETVLEKLGVVLPNGVKL
jgi:hypothetical protein